MLIGLTISVGTAAVMYTGVHHVQSGVLTTGELLMVMAYIAQMYEPLRLLSTKTTDLQSWLTSVDRAFVLLDEIPEVDESHGAKGLLRAMARLSSAMSPFVMADALADSTTSPFTCPVGRAWESLAQPARENQRCSHS